MFLVALGAHETIFLWRLTVFVSLAVRSVYIIEYFERSYNTHHAVSTEFRDVDDDTDEEDVRKEVEKTKELLEELKEDGKKMDIQMGLIDHLLYVDLETHRRNLSVKLLELREELRDVGGNMRTYKELMNNFVKSELLTLGSKVHEDIKVSGENESVADEVHEAYLSIQEATKAAKTTADRANLTYFIAQEISAHIQKKRWMIREEALDGIPELREEVRRMSLDFAARRMEAKVAADKAAEEQSKATVMLMEAVGIQQWEENKID